MSSDKNPRPWVASLGTEFDHDCGRDRIRITAIDGSETEVPGPDLREYLDLMGGGSCSCEPPYGDVFDRVRRGLTEAESRVRSEQARAEGDLAALLDLSAAERRRAAEADPRFQTICLATRALEEARKAVRQHPRRSLELAELGRCIAHLLNPQVYGARQLRDLQAYAEAVHGNVLRVNGELRAAHGSFLTARELLDLGTGDPGTALEIDRFETSLCRQVRDFPRALELSERVIAGNLELGEFDAAAQALQKRAIVLDVMGETERALEALQDAARLAEGSDVPLLTFTVHHSLALCLVRLGRPLEAEEWWPVIESAARRLSSCRIDATCLWLRGLIEHEHGNWSGAAETLERARAIFQEDDFLFDVANVSLDLAAAYAALGQGARVAELAAATYAYMEAHEVHRDALMALAVLRQAAVREELSRDLLRSLGQRLERAFAQTPPPAS